MDGSPVATVAAGRAEPLEAERLEWGEGRLPGTRALRMRAGAHPRLTYSAAGNLPRASGTVTMWTRREWDFSVERQPWRVLFATPMPPEGVDRIGYGTLWFWWYNSRLRGDQSDPKDRYICVEGLPLDDQWIHVAFSWRPERTDLFVNGRHRLCLDDSASPIRKALIEADAAAHPIDRSGIERFFVGNIDGHDIADSLLSDVRLYDAALSEEEIRAIWKEGLPPGEAGDADARKPIDWAALATASAGRYERPLAPGEAPGTLSPESLELVQEIRLDGSYIADPAPAGFRSIGDLRVGSLGGVPYLETGARKGDRFAVRLRLPAGDPVCLVEIDVPDDAVRTEDLILQPCKGDADYAMQVGLVLGDEYPNSGKMLTHRCIVWPRTDNVALVVMTAREGAPAAVAAIRTYRIRDGVLPAAAADAISRANAKAAMPQNPNRHLALYFEDPAINYEFGLTADRAATPAGFADELARIAATMKYTGEDTLFYPGAWYQGLIEADGYNPRCHAPGWRDGVYEVFDREGLGFIPTLNLNNIPVAPDLVKVSSIADGSLHGTPLVIHDSGKSNTGTWHDSPPNFNCIHPDVQRAVEGIVDRLVAEGAPHPSFGGVCLHLTQHCLLWWGSDRSGYNDYAVEAFARDTGRTIPDTIDRSAPLRGRDYAAWLRSDPALWNAWIQWRCDQMTAFWTRLAAKIAAARPGAKLVLNHTMPPDKRHPDFAQPDYVLRAAREAGLDVPALERAIPNLVVMMTDVPADYRWAERLHYPDDEAKFQTARAHQRILDATPGLWATLDGASRPWANQHDRYWESAIGGRGDSLSCDWLDECGWRVSTLNPAGDNAIRHYMLPLRFHDVQGLSKGGFLIGTYGMEKWLAPFARSFRALPPAVLPDLPGGTETVRLRGGEWNGRYYAYAVNTGVEPADVEMPSLPAGALDLATGQPAPAAGTSLRLPPHSLRSWGTPPAP